MSLDNEDLRKITLILIYIHLRFKNIDLQTNYLKYLNPKIIKKQRTETLFTTLCLVSIWSCDVALLPALIWGISPKVRRRDQAVQVVVTLTTCKVQVQ